MLQRIDGQLSKIASDSPAKPAPARPANPFNAVFEEANVHTTLIGGAAPNVDVANNPVQFATAAAADEIAKKLGGQVREDSLAGNFARSAPQRMIVGAGANAVNAGLVADLFAKYGDAPDGEAWRTINRDLGRSNA